LHLTGYIGPNRVTFGLRSPAIRRTA
jgi:hypothetical protein